MKNQMWNAPFGSHRLSVARWWVATIALQGAIVWLTFANFDENLIVSHPATRVELIASGLAIILLVLRTRAPWILLAGTVLIYLYFTIMTPAPLPLSPYLFALACGTYAVASTMRMRLALLLGLGLEVTLMTAGVVAKGATVMHVYTLPTTIAIVAAVTVGQLAYSRQRLIRSATQRAEEAERTREALASARLAEHKLATARDLHDLVSHRITAINLHAAAAARTLPPNADAALESLDTIQRSAQQIFAEIADLLADLRDISEPEETSRPGIAALRELVAATSERVELHLDDDVQHLPDAIATVVYRIVHEGLANAAKHGSRDSPTKVRITIDADVLFICVTNPTSPGGSEYETSTGYGLLGVHERADALGGVVRTDARDGHFRLSVEIPLSPS